MSRFDDDYDGPDDREESEDTEPMIRELRAEIVRLEAQLDQLSASARERAEESAVIAAQLADLQTRVARLEARRKRDMLFMRVTWVFIVGSLSLTAYTLYSQLSK